MKAFSLVIAAGAMVAVQGAANAAPGDTVYAQPGRLVPASGTRLNFYCMGSGSPAVVFDSGWEDWSPAWAVVQPQVAKWTRACSYDRAGAGFSEAGPMPRTSVRIADELHAALHNSGIEGPYILVGHAFGGDNVRTFADRYMSDVAGMVLVEADPGDVEPVELQEKDHRGQVGIIADLRECRDAVASGKPLPPLPSSPGQPARTCAQQFFRGLPEAEWSPELNAALLQLAQHKVAMYDAYISEMEEVPADELYLQQNRRSFGARPDSRHHHGQPRGRCDRQPSDQPRAPEVRVRHRARASSLARAVFQREAGVHAQQLGIRPVRRARRGGRRHPRGARPGEGRSG